jgi:glycosyltransferase involved in cell wall biosynthesis
VGLSVIVPAYNELSTFQEVLDRPLMKLIPGIEIEICIVESSSTDGSREVVLATQTIRGSASSSMTGNRQRGMLSARGSRWRQRRNLLATG